MRLRQISRGGPSPPAERFAEMALAAEADPVGRLAPRKQVWVFGSTDLARSMRRFRNHVNRARPAHRMLEAAHELAQWRQAEGRRPGRQVQLRLPDVGVGEVQAAGESRRRSSPAWALRGLAPGHGAKARASKAIVRPSRNSGCWPAVDLPANRAVPRSAAPPAVFGSTMGATNPSQRRGSRTR